MPSSAEPRESFFAAFCAAAGRCCGFGPAVVAFAIGVISYGTVWQVWLERFKGMRHGRIELYFYVGEVSLLIWSYVASVLRGPGFVPRGWSPEGDSTFEDRLPVPEMRPLNAPIQIEDYLQWCAPCQGYKPPRAHHCSSCRRCVHWMDHHCPWTNTCVGHTNMKSFVLFVHYVPLACFHSVVLLTEVLYKLWSIVRSGSKKSSSFLTLLGFFFSDLRTICACICWLAALIIMCLVGFLAWEMGTSITTNMSMVEENVMERAERRRQALLEPPVTFPYDLGFKANFRQLFGSWRLTWILPTRTEGDPFWPAVQPKANKHNHGELVLAMEQLAQKAHKNSKSWFLPISRPFTADMCTLRGCLCCWCCCKVMLKFGCAACCDMPALDEPRITIKKGDRVLVSRRVEHWMFGRLVLPPALETSTSSQQPSEKRFVYDSLVGHEGWFPSLCVQLGKETRNHIPSQKLLTGFWETQSGTTIRVVGPLVYVWLAPEEEAPPFILKTGYESHGDGKPFAVLQGCRVESCDDKIVRWSSGDVWYRKEGCDASGKSVRKAAPDTRREDTSKATVVNDDSDSEASNEDNIGGGDEDDTNVGELRQRRRSNGQQPPQSSE